MPCSAQDLQSPHFRPDDQRATLEHESRDVFYRPLYALSDYDRLVDGWVETFDANAQPSCTIDLDLGSETPWSYLGFPKLDREDDHAADHGMSDACARSGMTNNTQFNRLYLPSSASVSLYGLQAFDVERGFWNIDVNPYKTTRSGDEAEESLMKITRVLCSYKISIKANFGRSMQSCDHRPTVFGVSPSIAPDDEGSLRYETRNDTVIVPQLLAVLAKRF